VGHRVAMEARRHGLLLRPLGNVMVLMPPLITSAAELARMVEIVGRSIRTVTETDPP
jgi:adenosylmethionine---8-amino-7-oxononanoate aminotransferase